MDLSELITGLLQERLGKTINIENELSNENSTEILIAKMEVTMSKDEFKDFILKASSCLNETKCDDLFENICVHCKINKFTSKFSKFIQ